MDWTWVIQKCQECWFVFSWEGDQFYVHGEDWLYYFNLSLIPSLEMK